MNSRTNEKTNQRSLSRVMNRRAEIDDIRQANAKKRIAFLGKAMRLDDCLTDGRGKERENAAFSDRGREAARIRSASELPLWRELFDLAYQAQRESDKKIIDALFSDVRPAFAARIAGTNRQRVYRVIKRFRRDLSAAYIARHLGL